MACGYCIVAISVGHSVGCVVWSVKLPPSTTSGAGIVMAV